MTLRILGVLSAFLLMSSTFALAEVTAEKSDRGIVIKIDGKLFTEYLTKAGQSPAMWPIIGPTGEEMTRAHPFKPSPKGKYDTEDHPHHQSLWFTHDKVSGADFWKANVNEGEGDRGPHEAHREFVKIDSDGDTATVVTRNDWMNGDKRILEDERTVVYGTRKNGDRWIDFTITLKAPHADVTFGDTKEGTFAIRVPDPMRVEAKLGGRITNSEGQTDDAAWGQPAKWVDYTGPTSATPTSDNSPVGIAILSHPKSFRPVPRWHVRAYGLFAANPFGQVDFPNPEAAKQGPVTIKKGDSLTLRYLVLFHRGQTDAADLNAAFEEFASR
jgi:Methane oxygenase PmoA